MDLHERGFWGDQEYYHRIEDASGNPNDNNTRSFKEGAYAEHDIVDAGFLEMVRLGIKPPADPLVAGSLDETDKAFVGNATIKITLMNGDQYWHRYVHGSYGESAPTAMAGPIPRPTGDDCGRCCPVSAPSPNWPSTRPADKLLTSMADAGNPGYLIPDEMWDQTDAFGFTQGEATNSASALAWAKAQYVRLGPSIDAGHSTETPTVVQKRYASTP